MLREERESQAAVTSEPAAGTRGPRWRALLEARWQARLREVTELSLAYHVAAAAVPGGTGDGAGQPQIRALLGRTVAARRKLADVEDALGRPLRVLRAVRVCHPGRAARHRARVQVLPAL